VSGSSSTPPRAVFALVRAADASPDALLALAPANTDPKIIAFSNGWFGKSGAADIRIFSLDLARQIARSGWWWNQVSKPLGSGLLTLDLSLGTGTAIPVTDRARSLYHCGDRYPGRAQFTIPSSWTLRGEHRRPIRAGRRPTIWCASRAPGGHRLA
jgi:hypothetical protein